MTVITLTANDLSVVTGLNPYKTRRDGWEKVLKKHTTIGFRAYVERIGEIPSWLHTSHTTSSNMLMQDIRDDVCETVELRVDSGLKRSISLDSVGFEKLQKRQFGKSGLGALHENRVFEKIRQESIPDLVRDGNTYRKPLFEGFDMVGRVEGRTGTSVVEIKNRLSLFDEVRDFEKVELFGYMFLLGKKESFLVETSADRPSAIHQISWDQSVWNATMREIRKSFNSSAPKELKMFFECPY